VAVPLSAMVDLQYICLPDVLANQATSETYLDSTVRWQDVSTFSTSIILPKRVWGKLGRDSPACQLGENVVGYMAHGWKCKESLSWPNNTSVRRSASQRQ
jgi:hypothetical protein